MLAAVALPGVLAAQERGLSVWFDEPCRSFALPAWGKAYACDFPKVNKEDSASPPGPGPGSR